MGTERKTHSQNNLPFKLDEAQWGTINEVTEKCPGVYGVCTDPTEGRYAGRKLFAVTSAAVPSIISQEVIDHGIKAGDAWVFEYTGPDSIYNLVRFEVTQYRVKRGLPPDESEDTLHSFSVYYGEYFPWYFGGTIPPRNTPFGLTIRVKKASEGLFFLETDQCRWVLAISFPIWYCELTPYVTKLGTLCDDDLSTRVTLSRYLFIPIERCAPAIDELLQGPDHKGLQQFVRSKEALDAALQKHFPEYFLEDEACRANRSGTDRADYLIKELRAKEEELAKQEFLLLP